MTIKAEVYMECDECGADLNEDMKPDEKADDIIDREGWAYSWKDSNKLLCDECAENECAEKEEL